MRENNCITDDYTYEFGDILEEYGLHSYISFITVMLTCFLFGTLNILVLFLLHIIFTQVVLFENRLYDVHTEV